MSGENKFPLTLSSLLKHRKENSLFRTLKTNYPGIDFSSNDYLGFSTKGLLHYHVQKLDASVKHGATGSRLISGNSFLFEDLEKEISQFHSAEAALIFNSGYDANLGLLSSVPQKGDLIIGDELIHASLIDGIRLSFATHYKFKHNDIESLTDLLSRQREKFKEAYLVVESVYSMDGDLAPLTELVKLCKQYNMHLIVDEAHAIGVFGHKGKGLCNELNIEKDCFARIYTYGKAMGCHGAAVLGNIELREYLINFSRSFIYTTAMPEHSVLSVKAAYQLLDITNEIEKLRSVISYFNSKIKNIEGFIESNSSIHCKVVPGNETVQALENKLASAGIFVKSIKNPTVKETQERLRICLHSYNTQEEMDQLFELLA